MFKDDSVDTCAGKFPLTSMEGRAEGLAYADPEARTPIGVSGNLYIVYKSFGPENFLLVLQCNEGIHKF